MLVANVKRVYCLVLLLLQENLNISHNSKYQFCLKYWARKYILYLIEYYELDPINVCFPKHYLVGKVWIIHIKKPPSHTSEWRMYNWHSKIENPKEHSKYKWRTECTCKLSFQTLRTSGKENNKIKVTVWIQNFF